MVAVTPRSDGIHCRARIGSTNLSGLGNRMRWLRTGSKRSAVIQWSRVRVERVAMPLSSLCGRNQSQRLSQ